MVGTAGEGDCQTDTVAVALVIDSRKVGFNHHLLSVGMTFKKYTRPLAWSVHQGKKEQSRVEEQLAFFKPVASMMPSAVEIWGSGETEFQSVRLLRWFGSLNWPFVIRPQGKITIALALEPGQKRVTFRHLTKKYDHGCCWLLRH